MEVVLCRKCRYGGEENHAAGEGHMVPCWGWLNGLEVDLCLKPWLQQINDNEPPPRLLA